MKKTLFSLFTAVSLALLYCPVAFALTEDEAAAAVNAQGKDAVSGNLVSVVAVCYRFYESQYQTERHPTFTGHRRFALARLDAIRGIAGFPRL